MKDSFFIAIEGVIGVGKTTLARLLQPRLQTELLLEAFEENPFLSDFYADRALYAFQTQMFFLLSRYRQQQVARRLLAQGPLITDYTFAKDSLFAHLNLTGDELDIYEQLHAVLADHVVLPDLVIYLRADTDLLMSRIAMRDRPYERQMDREYIERLRQAYDRHFSDYDQTALLVIEARNFDYVLRPDDLAAIETQVKAALGLGPQQPALLPAASPGVTFTPTPRETAPGETDDRMLAEFLAANEALARAGLSLTGRAATLRAALSDALTHLERLARAAGVASAR